MDGKQWLRIGFSLAIAGLVLYRVPAADLWTALAGVRGEWLALAFACVVAMVSARAYRWHRLLEAGHSGRPAQESIRSLLGGFTLSLATPGRTGEMGRCLFTGEADRARVFLLNLLDRSLDSWALWTFGVVSLMVLRPRPYGVFALGVWLVLLPLVMAMPALFQHLGEIPWWPEGFRKKLREAGSSIVEVRLPHYAAWALFSTGSDLITFYCLLNAFLPLPFLPVLVTCPLILIVGGLPIAIGGLGPREGAAAVLLAQYAVPSAVAIDASLLLWIASAVLPAVAGAIWLAVTRIPLPGFKEGARTPARALETST